MTISDASSSTSQPALLELRSARIDHPGGVLWPERNGRVDRTNVALVGAFGPLFQWLGGEAELVAGSLTILGHNARHAVQRGRVGVARKNVPRGNSFRAWDWVQVSAELTGRTPKEAHSATAAAFERFSLYALAKRSLSQLNLVEERLLNLAQATVTDPEVVVVEGPLAELQVHDTATIATALGVILRRARLIAWVFDVTEHPAELDLVRSLGAAAVLDDEAAGGGLRVLDPEQLVPTPHGFRVSVEGDPTAFVRALGARGLHAVNFPALASSGRIARLHVGPAQSSRLVVEAALETRTPLLGLHPLPDTTTRDD